MKKLMIALFALMLAAPVGADGWNMSATARVLYGSIVQTRDFLTVDTTGAPVKCRFYGHDAEELTGVVTLAYVTWEDRSEVTRREMLFWRVVQGDVLDIEGNYFVMTSGGQLARISMDTQRVWPASW